MQNNDNEIQVSAPLGKSKQTDSGSYNILIFFFIYNTIFTNVPTFQPDKYHAPDRSNEKNEQKVLCLLKTKERKNTANHYVKIIKIHKLMLHDFICCKKVIFNHNITLWKIIISLTIKKLLLFINVSIINCSIHLFLDSFNSIYS